MFIKEALCYVILLPLGAAIAHGGQVAMGESTRAACAVRVGHANAQLVVHQQAPSLSVEKECY